jgi:hypothetical protein
MPDGYNAACYGGDFSKSLAGVNPIYSARLDVPESAYPVLKHTLYRVAARHHAKTFDGSRNTNRFRMFSVSLCSEAGLFAFVDKREWVEPGGPSNGPDAVMVNVFAYRDTQRWEQLARDLDSELREQWPSQLELESTANTRLLNSRL